MKILLVDDEIRNLKLLEEMLGIFNHTLLKVMNGRMALSVLKENPDTDLVLLDVMMPDMDGYETCAAMKADNALKDIPIIFITALADDANQVKGFKYGAVDYVTKPFKIEILEARVNTHLLIKKQRDSLVKLLAEKDGLISDLTEAMAHIKTLKSILPICASCKKIRNDEGYWHQVDAYIATHTDTKFSHSICPDCITKLYPDIAADLLKEMDKLNQVVKDKSQTLT
ncbi:MAG: response regulator [Lentisphaerota bacterium]